MDDYYGEMQNQDYEAKDRGPPCPNCEYSEHSTIGRCVAECEYCGYWYAIDEGESSTEQDPTTRHQRVAQRKSSV